MSYYNQGNGGQAPRNPAGFPGQPGAFGQNVHPSANGGPNVPSGFRPGLQHGGPPSTPPGAVPPGGVFQTRPGFPRPSGPSSNPLPAQPGPGGFVPRAPTPGGMRPPGSMQPQPRPVASNPVGGFMRPPGQAYMAPPPTGVPPQQGGGFPQAQGPGSMPTMGAMPSPMANLPGNTQTAPAGFVPGRNPMQPGPQGATPFYGPGQGMPGQVGPPPIGGAPGMHPPPMMMGARPQAPGMTGGGGFMPPAPPGAGGGYQQTLDQFQSLTLGPSGPGAQDSITDPSSLPRPTGSDAEAAMNIPVQLESSNCPPCFIRPTIYSMPRNGTLLQRFHLPVGAVVCPLAEGPSAPEVPLVKLDSSGIVRCRRCRTYINPHVTWADGGRRWTCNVCNCLNEVGMEYFCTLDGDGQRRDLDERPELNCGAVEYVAPPEYMVRGPMPTVYFFVIDVCAAAVRSGMVAKVAETIKSVLDKLPGDDRKKVGFLTVDKTLHFYNLKSSLSQPQMMVVAEVDDPFLPLPDDMLVNLKESRDVVDALLDNLPSTFANTQIVESAMGSALQAAFLVMQHVGGKLLMFLSSVPTLGPGKIKNRDNAGLYGTDRESTLRNPEDPFYKKIAAECSRCQISVDTFTFGSQYMDLASIVSIPRYTGGQVYYYPGFYIQRDGLKLSADLKRNLTRTTGWEAVMRIRCSRGLRISSFNGSFFIRSSDLLALPTVDPDKAFAVQIAHEEQVLDGNSAYIQSALLYTASCGERRIRVHTLKLGITSELSELYKSADAASLSAILIKLGVERSQTTRLDDCRRAVESKVVSSLREYRSMHSSHFRGINKLIYPDSLKYLPVWVLGILKSTALRGGPDVQPDERIAAGYEIMSSPLSHVCSTLYPSVYPLGHMKGGWPKAGNGKVGLPPSTPSSHNLLDPSGIYLIDAGRVLMLWVGRGTPKEVLCQIFGPEATAKDLSQLPIEPAKDNPASKMLCRILADLRSTRGIFPQCYVIPQGSQMEAHIAPYFIEDRLPASYSYLDFMLHVHRNIGAKH